MDKVEITIDGQDVDQDLARLLARQIAERRNPDTILLSWHNRQRKAQSPCCLGHDLGGRPAWEVYGEGHGGKLRVSVNGGAFVFVFS